MAKYNVHLSECPLIETLCEHWSQIKKKTIKLMNSKLTA